MACEGWIVRSVEELKAPTNGAIAIGPFGSRMKSDCYVPSGVPVIRGNNIGDTRVLVGEMVHITPKLADQLGNAIVHADDLVFPHRGAIGQVGIVPRNSIERYALSSSLMKLTCDRSQVEPLFLFYFFRSANGQHELLKNASTVGTPGIGQPLSSLRSIKVPLPPLAEQQAIAAVLGALDDKIELNRRMNATLEAMARALFQSWFIDFDPVRAKADGRTPVGLDAEAARLFPACFDKSDLGLIPEGWQVRPFSEAFKIPLRNGLTRPKSVRGSGIQMVNMGELFAHRRIGHIDMDRVPLSEIEMEKNRIEIGDLLFARQSLTLEGAGQCSIVTESRERRTFESHLIRCRLDSKIANHWYFFYYFLSAQGKNRITSIVEQVAAAGIRGSDLARMTVLMPPYELQRHFGELVTDSERMIAANNDESRTLAALRDALLPKLLSGELRADGQLLGAS